MCIIMMYCAYCLQYVISFDVAYNHSVILIRVGGSSKEIKQGSGKKGIVFIHQVRHRKDLSFLVT